MIVQPALYNLAQPTARFAERTVHSLAERLADPMERGPQAFADAAPMDGEPPVCPSLGDRMGETKKIERFRSALAPPFPIFGRLTAEFDQTGFIGVQLQTKLDQAFLECFQAGLSLVSVLEPIT